MELGKRRGMTQEQGAVRISVSVARFSQIERGSDLVGKSCLRRIRRCLVAGHAQLADDATPFPVPERYIAFDAEYTAGNVWLLGVRVVRPDGDLCYSIWASPPGEAQALMELDTTGSHLDRQKRRCACDPQSGLRGRLRKLEKMACLECRLGDISTFTSGRGRTFSSLYPASG